MNLLYAAARDLLVAPNLFDPELVSMWRETEVRCRHRWWIRLRDRLRGEPHGRTHTIMEPLITIALFDDNREKMGEVQVEWDATGVFRL